MYRECWVKILTSSLTTLGTKRKEDFEPYWQDEKNWLCTVEFLPSDDPEARLFAADERPAETFEELHHFYGTV